MVSERTRPIHYGNEIETRFHSATFHVLDFLCAKMKARILIIENQNV